MKDDKRILKVHIADMEVRKLLYNLWFNRKVLRRNNPSEKDRERIRDNVQYSLRELDKFKVPFFVQNQIIALAEDGESFDEYIAFIDQLEEAKEVYYEMADKFDESARRFAEVGFKAYLEAWDITLERFLEYIKTYEKYFKLPKTVAC